MRAAMAIAANRWRSTVGMVISCSVDVLIEPKKAAAVVESLMLSGQQLMARIDKEHDRLNALGLQFVHQNEQRWVIEKETWVNQTAIELAKVIVSAAHVNRFSMTPYPDAQAANLWFNVGSTLRHVGAYVDRLEEFRREILDRNMTMTVEAHVGDKNTFNISGGTVGAIAAGHGAAATGSVKNSTSSQLREGTDAALDALRREFAQLSDEASDLAWRVLTRVRKLELDSGPNQVLLEKLIADVGALEIARFAEDVRKLPPGLELAGTLVKEAPLGEFILRAGSLAAEAAQRR